MGKRQGTGKLKGLGWWSLSNQMWSSTHVESVPQKSVSLLPNYSQNQTLPSRALEADLKADRYGWSWSSQYPGSKPFRCLKVSRTQKCTVHQGNWIIQVPHVPGSTQLAAFCSMCCFQIVFRSSSMRRAMSSLDDTSACIADSRSVFSR